MAKAYKNWTIQQKLIAYLATTGAVEVPSKTGKYRTFKRTDGRYLFLGKMGSVRTNSRQSVSGSFSVTESYHAKLAEYEQREGLREELTDVSQ